MQKITPELISGKRVLLRFDIDVPIENGEVVEDLRLIAGIPTLDMCLIHAASVVIFGHVGRPKDKDPKYSVKPVASWFEKTFADVDLPEGKLHILENTRFERGEEEMSIDFARELASLGDVYINEAFAAHNPSASTTILPTLLPHAAGLNFVREVETLLEVRNNPKKPQVALIGGAKVEGKYQAAIALSKTCDLVLIGGLLAKNIKEQNLEVPKNMVLATLDPSGVDISESSTEMFIDMIAHSKQVIWGGPMGKYEVEEGMKATKKIAEAIINSKVDSIIGGGDTTAALADYLEKFSFVSTGGGAMLELLAKGTLPTIDVLK